MRAPQFSVNDYVGALQALFPRGLVWPRAADSTQAAVLRGLAPVYYRTNQSANELLVVSFPATVDDLLPEWNATLGLPGRFGYTGDDLATQQAQVVAALTDSGGQSVAFFLQLLASLGCTATIRQYRPTRVNDAVNTPIRGREWAHVWVVTVSGSADPVVVEAVLERYKPAHTEFFVVFTGSLVAEDGSPLVSEGGDPLITESGYG